MKYLLCKQMTMFLKLRVNTYASEFGRSFASLKWRSTVLETNHWDWFMVKCQLLPKWASRTSSTKGSETKGCGPLVEMKFSISVIFCKSGRLSVEVLFKLLTSTSTMDSLNDRFKKHKANVWSDLHLSAAHTITQFA